MEAAGGVRRTAGAAAAALAPTVFRDHRIFRRVGRGSGGEFVGGGRRGERRRQIRLCRRRRRRRRRRRISVRDRNRRRETGSRRCWRRRWNAGAALTGGIVFGGGCGGGEENANLLVGERKDFRDFLHGHVLTEPVRASEVSLLKRIDFFLI